MADSFDARGRFARNYLTFADRNSKEFLLYLSGPGVYNSPAADVETTSVPGRNGDIVSENAKSGQRRFQNVEITYDAFFFSGLPAKTAAVKSWLLSPVGYQKLQDTYDPDFYRMAVCTSALEFSVTRQQAASMTLKFQCKPQRFSTDGQKAVTLTKSGSVMKNPFQFPAQPLIRLYGSGEGTLAVNNVAVTIYSITDYIDLNCETQNAYNALGFCNTDIYVEDFPELTSGENKISWEGGITAVEITPRWWTL